MSILQRLKDQQSTEEKKLFAIIAGPRLGGKSSLAGTLPGRTLMLQVAVLESGSKSAKALAEQRGNQIDVLNFSTRTELLEIIQELATDKEYDSIYVDGLSALGDLIVKEPKIIAKMKSDNWAAFREIGELTTETILKLKELTYPSKTAKPKAVFLTCALKIRQDKAGVIVDVDLETKGNVAVSQVTKLGEAVLTVLPPLKTEQGDTGHRLITKTEDVWPGRIDGILAERNPGVIAPADLAMVLKLREGG